MIITTTSEIEGRVIVEYKGIVFGEVVAGIDFIRDFKASITNVLGGRSASYEEELIHSREAAIEEMKDRAKAIGANAIVGIKLDYEMLGQGNNMMMVIASGTAVYVD
jgi:uncharacterized protein YbjQ (UPF0145 family)